MFAEAPAVEARDLSRSQKSGGEVLHILDDLALSVAQGEVVAVTGPSGSGKSTLLYLLGGLDEPDAGQVLVTGVDWQSMNGNERAEFRRRSCGFIAQGLTLLPQATAAENVEVPLLLAGVDADERRRLVERALARVELEGEAGKLSDQLSGGQQQRVAIARALVNEPAVVLADEPTASLDSASAQVVVRVLLAAAAETQAAVVLVTHDPSVARHAGRILAVKAGRLEAAAPYPNGGV